MNQVFVSLSMSSRKGLYQEQKVVLEDLAEHDRGLANFSGMLTLTERKLSFRSSNLLLRNYVLEFSLKDIELKDIERVDKCSILFILPTGLRLSLIDGTKHTFSLSNRDLWYEQLDSIAKQK